MLRTAEKADIQYGCSLPSFILADQRRATRRFIEGPSIVFTHLVKSEYDILGSTTKCQCALIEGSFSTQQRIDRKFRNIAAFAVMAELREAEQNAASVHNQSVSTASDDRNLRDTSRQAVSTTPGLPHPARPHHTADKDQIDRKISDVEFDKLSAELENLEKKLNIQGLELDRMNSDFRLEHAARIVAEKKLRNRDSARDREMEEKDVRIAVLEQQVQAKTIEELQSLRIQRLESDVRLFQAAKVNAEDELRERDSERDQEMEEKNSNLRMLRKEVQWREDIMDSLEDELDLQSHELRLTNDKVDTQGRKIENLVQSSQSAKARFEEELQLKERQIKDLAQSSQNDKVRYLEELQLKERRIKDLVQSGQNAQAQLEAEKQLDERKKKDLEKSNESTVAQLQKDVQIKDEELQWKNERLESKVRLLQIRDKTIQRLKDCHTGYDDENVEDDEQAEQAEQEGENQEGIEDRKHGWEDGWDELDEEQTKKRVWDCWTSKY